MDCFSARTSRTDCAAAWESRTFCPAMTERMHESLLLLPQNVTKVLRTLPAVCCKGLAYLPCRLRYWLIHPSGRTCRPFVALCVPPVKGGANQATGAEVNVWSAAIPASENAGGRLVCAKCITAFVGEFSPGHDGMRCALFSLSRQSCESFFTPQVSGAPGSTVEPSHCSPADLAEKSKIPQ